MAKTSPFPSERTAAVSAVTSPNRPFVKPDWQAQVAYMQLGAFRTLDSAEREVDRVEARLDNYRTQYPATSFEKIKVLVHRGKDGLFRIYGDHFNSYEDARFVCGLFQQDYNQPCFPIRKDAMKY